MAINKLESTLNQTPAIQDVFKRETDYFNLAETLRKNKDAQPEQIFNAIKSQLQNLQENANVGELVSNILQSMEDFTDKEKKLFAEVCKKITTRDYDDDRSDGNVHDPLYCIADVMFKIGKNMPENFYNVAKTIKAYPVTRDYFSITENDTNNRWTLKNMAKYFQEKNHGQFHFNEIEFDENTIDFICEQIKDIDSFELVFDEDLDDNCKEKLKNFQQTQKSNQKTVKIHIAGSVL